jgi:hypothetical protein
MSTNITPGSLRKTGIRALDDMAWGSHICVFYETKEDLLDTATTYFNAGLESNELCVWAISAPITENDAKTALRRAVPDIDEKLSEGRVELLQGRDWYLQGNQFDLKRITNGWNEKLSAALARGYAGMRVSGNAFWIATNHWKEFCEYEQELDRSLADQSMMVLCTYPLGASRAVEILDVARAHQYTLARRRGDWEFLESPELKQAKIEIQRRSISGEYSGRRFAISSFTPRSNGAYHTTTAPLINVLA